MNRQGEMVLVDEIGRERERYGLQYGARLMVEDGQRVKGGQLLAEWDPFAMPIVVEVSGHVKYGDIIDGVMESPDMMNIYNGIVTLDTHGNAVVEMPDWFSALNRDFRYTLTAIGSPAPKLYIAEELHDNRFRIAGGKKGQRVSWQITGIRQDAGRTRTGFLRRK